MKTYHCVGKSSPETPVFTIFRLLNYITTSGVVANLELGNARGYGGGASSGVQGQSPWSGGQGHIYSLI